MRLPADRANPRKWGAGIEYLVVKIFELYMIRVVFLHTKPTSLKMQTQVQQEVFVQMALKAWNIQVERATKLIDALSDAQVTEDIVAGKNSVLYLIGHLVAANDSMIGLFGLGERQYAHFDEPFLKSPDKSGQTMPSVQELRATWKKANETLSAYFAGMTADDWMSKHTAMSDEDFAKEPSRNKMSVLLNRTNHLAYHLGQMIWKK
jgi:uncharacterized damage-inducible protein DinB